MNSHLLDSRRTRGLPGGSYWFGVLVTRGVLARHPKDSLGEALGVGFSGIRGSLELLPDVLSRLKHSGTRGSLRTLPGILSRSITRGTWHSPKGGSKGQFRRCFQGDLRQGFGDIRHIFEGGLSA